MIHVCYVAFLTLVFFIPLVHPAVAQTPSKQVDSKTIAALIAQLGSAAFLEREAATKSLETIGWPALAALREAADNQDEAEVRQRAKKLVEKIENSLEQLLEDYKAYGLPLPPKDAPLVRFASGGGHMVNGVVQPLTYSLGFLLKPGSKKEPPVILQGTLRYEPAENRPVTLLDPAKGTAQEIGGWVADAKNDLLPLAVQCKARGWDSLAQTFFVRRLKEKDAPLPKAALSQEAWYYWQYELTKPDTDWPTAARYMHHLMRSTKELSTPENLGLLRSLDLAMVPSKAKPGSIEALIDALVEVRSTDLSLDPDNKPDPRYLNLVEAGFDAVPDLIEHLDDDRLTRIYRPLSPQQRVRDIVAELIDGLAGHDLSPDWFNEPNKTEALEWFKKARIRGEEAQAVAQVFFSRDQRWLNDQPLRIIVKKYPKQLPKIYRTLLDQHPSLESWSVAEALTQSNTSRAERIELFVLGARHERIEHRQIALGRLLDLDDEKFVQLLVETLGWMPRTPKEQYWLSTEARLAYLVMRSGDPRAWNALDLK